MKVRNIIIVVSQCAGGSLEVHVGCMDEDASIQNEAVREASDTIFCSESYTGFACPTCNDSCREEMKFTWKTLEQIDALKHLSTEGVML